MNMALYGRGAWKLTSYLNVTVIAGTLAGLGCPYASFAASSLNGSESDFFTDIPVGITVSRMRQPLNEAAASMTVIDREMIEASGATEVVDLLRLVPGFQVSGGTINSPYLVAYHGQSDIIQRGIEVLVDGASVYSSYMSVDWRNLGVAIEDIERIEVLRGGGAPTYGYNAFTSTINIITREPFSVPGVYAGGYVGSRDSRSATLRYGDIGRAGSYRLTGKVENTDGNRDRQDGSRLRSLNFRGQADISLRDELDIKLSVTDGDLGNSPDIPLREQDAYRDMQSNRQRIRWTRTFSGDRDLYVQAYRQYTKQDDRGSLGLLSDLIGVAPGDIPALFDGRPDQEIQSGWYTYEEERHDIEMQYRDYGSGPLSWVVGAGARQEAMKSFETFSTNNWKRDNSVRAFWQSSYRISDQWIANVGGMLEHGDLYDTGASYRAGLNYSPRPNHTFRLTYSHSERKPTLFEEYFDKALYFDDGAVLDQITRSQGNLEPEELDTVDIGYVGRLWRGALFVDLRLFYEQLDNQRRSYQDITTGYPEYINIGAEVWYPGRIAVDTWGLEGQLKTEPWQGAHASFQFAFLRSEDQYSVTETGLATREDHVPDSTLSLLLAQDLGHQTSLGVAYYFLDEMSWNGDATLGAPSLIKETHRVDVRLAKRVGRYWMFEGIAKNLAGRYEKGVRGESGQDPRFFLRVSAQF